MSYAVDTMLSAMARLIRNGDVVTTGVASLLPMLAVVLAKETHAPELTYLNCVGAVNPEWTELPHTSVEPTLLPGAAFIRLDEIWEMANQGRVDLMFFGAFQIDARGRTNLHRLRSGRKLPGIAGASTMRRKVKRPVLFTTRHDRRTFVEGVDAVTTSARGDETTQVVTPLGILSLGAMESRIDSLLAGRTLQEIRDRTGFPLTTLDTLETLAPPSREEVEALDRLDPEGKRRVFLKNAGE